MRRKYWLWLLLPIVLLPVLGLCFLRYAPDQVIWCSEIRHGNQIVAEIESYRHQHGNIPTQLSEVAGNSATLDQFFYKSCNDHRYILWFGTELGESMTHDSDAR